MRDVGNIPYAGYVQAGRLEGPYGGLSPSAGPFDENIHLPESLVHTLAGCGLCRSLGCKGGTLSGAFEARCPGAGRP